MTFSWPALVLATAIALAVTTGVPALMQSANPVVPHVDTVASSAHWPRHRPPKWRSSRAASTSSRRASATDGEPLVLRRHHRRRAG